MIELNKTFRIFFIITKLDDTALVLEKRYTQTNQKFEMNVIFAELVRVLSLVLHSLEEIDFKDLSIRIEDYREIVLHH